MKTFCGTLQNCSHNNSRIPSRNYTNFPLVGEAKYRVESLCWDDGDLVVYQIISDEGNRLQAQQFDLCRLPNNVFRARKRRIYRLRKTNRVVEEIKLDGVKVFVTHVSKSATSSIT